MIVGGLDRGIDYGPLTAALLARHPHPVLITVPTNGPRIAADYRAAHPDRVHDAPSLDDAVRLAATLTAATYTSSTGATTVILSPAAPSQDHYLDFAVKSAAFIAAIDALPAAATPHA